MSAPTPPARLHVLFARDAPVAVIFRRGPSHYVRMIRWRTDTDTFEPGQWVKHHIYGERCGLSPNGELLVYFAGKHTFGQSKREATATWTAISRPPYWSALCLWPKGDAWNGGGFFSDDRTVHLCHGEPLTRHSEFTPAPWLTVVAGGSESDSVWRLAQRGDWRDPDPYSPDVGYDPPWIWERTLADGGALVVTEFGYGDAHRRRHLRRADGAEIALPDAEWMDFDQTGRLVFVRAGCLFVADIADDGTVTETQLADFNDMAFEPLPPPDWARQWPDEPA